MGIPQRKKRKAATTRPRTRKRPFKNSRERQRRARINNKLTELCDLCSSDAITSIVPRASAAVKGLAMSSKENADDVWACTPKPSKMDILRDSIHIFEAMDKELIKLRT